MAFSVTRKRKSFRGKLFGSNASKPPKGTGSSTDHSGINYESGSPYSRVTSSALRNLSEVKSIRLGNFLTPAPASAPTRMEPLRVFVSTWNAGGNMPTNELNPEDFIPLDDHSDIYVLGFQEIVPLNAGNVLVVEDHEPAIRWLFLINQVLNRPHEDEPVNGHHIRSASADSTGSPTSSHDPSLSNYSKTPSVSPFLQKSSLKTASKTFMSVKKRQLKACNCPVEMTKRSYKDACFGCSQSYIPDTDSSEEEEEEDQTRNYYNLAVNSMASGTSTSKDQLKFSLVACKQMVGLFVTVWVRKQLVQHIGHLRITCVGRGIMGRLGNKGCISVSMTLHQTTFCFICSHLTSGDKEGDELRRNSDVVEILRLTQFKRMCKRGARKIPERILDHDLVIWLGDLNYRIALDYSETKKLLTENNWDALFENDQLNIEREAGRVFKGWNEGKIVFAPTYKYSYNSDAYAGDSSTSRKKRRTPAWCDRILWHGNGVVQSSYFRGESKFSDHRPVCAEFTIEVSVLESKLVRGLSSPNMRVGVEELLPRLKIS